MLAHNGQTEARCYIRQNRTCIIHGKLQWMDSSCFLNMIENFCSNVLVTLLFRRKFYWGCANQTFCATTFNSLFLTPNPSWFFFNKASILLMQKVNRQRRRRKLKIAKCFAFQTKLKNQMVISCICIPFFGHWIFLIFQIIRTFSPVSVTCLNKHL